MLSKNTVGGDSIGDPPVGAANVGAEEVATGRRPWFQRIANYGSNQTNKIHYVFDFSKFRLL